MKHLIFSFYLLAFSFAGVSAQKFIHPGVLHTTERIKYMRILVEEQVQPAYGSFLLLKEHPCAQANYEIKGPFRVISRDGAFGYTKSKMESDFSAAYLNSLMWILTGNKAHAG
ncbi:MAG: hypothetical protein LBB64_05010, partial [Dysgonamonadaceae bacterium]|nr:hypothetical protein [Dysgonamonadaceae bacterium]